MKRNILLAFILIAVVFYAGAQIPELWGLAANGGATNNGTIIKINGDSTGFTRVYSMTTPGGSFPGGNLIYSNGLFYGTTFLAGTKSAGTLFSINPATNAYTKLRDMDSLGGSWINSNLVRLNDSTLYGVIYQWGTGPFTGRLFKFNPITKVYNTVYRFTDTTQGKWPRALMLASNNTLYGITSGGGAHGYGGVFSFNPDNNNYTALHHFDTTAYIGAGAPVDAGNGFLYGIVSYGGDTTNSGAIYSINLATSAFTTVYNFDGVTGNPNWNNTMVKATDNKLYGMTYYGGGPAQQGVIFSFNPAGNMYSKLAYFNGANGANPISTLMQASDGNFYGTTRYGGASDSGAIFSYHIGDTSITLLKSLTGATGCNPFGGLTELPVAISGITGPDNLLAMEVYPNPAREYFVVRTGSVQSNSYLKVSVYNLLGEVIATEATLPGSNLIVDTRNYTPGIYFVTVSDGVNERSRKVVVE